MNKPKLTLETRGLMYDFGFMPTGSFSAVEIFKCDDLTVNRISQGNTSDNEKVWVYVAFKIGGLELRAFYRAVEDPDYHTIALMLEQKRFDPIKMKTFCLQRLLDALDGKPEFFAEMLRNQHGNGRHMGERHVQDEFKRVMGIE